MLSNVYQCLLTKSSNKYLVILLVALSTSTRLLLTLRQISQQITGKHRKKNNFLHSVHGGYHTTLGYNVIHDVFVLFTFAYAKVEVIRFHTLVSDPVASTRVQGWADEPREPTVRLPD